MGNNKLENAIKKQERLGEINYSNFGSKMTIIEYNNTNDVVVLFENGHTMKIIYNNFINGAVSSPYDKTQYGVGYMGEGEYISRLNNKKTSCYNTWHDMFRRCYSKVLHDKRPTYVGCTVCDEWHNFQVFAKWYDENYYEIECERMCLDKDILHKGNKFYSPETCVFAPNNINVMFTKSDGIRGKFPIGVSHTKNHKSYASRCCDGSRNRIDLGEYKTPELAFYAYKECKENIIKLMSEQYKINIPKILYNAMNTYKVEITD